MLVWVDVGVYRSAGADAGAALAVGKRRVGGRRVCVSRECHEGQMQIAEDRKAGSVGPTPARKERRLTLLANSAVLKWGTARV